MLTYHLDRLFEFMAGGDDQPPVPEQVVIVELNDVEHDSKGRAVLGRSELRTIEEYAPRFAELLSAGYPWIHMTYLGLLDGKGLVTIDFPKYPPKPSTVGHTSVNFASALRRVRDEDWDVSPSIVWKD